MSSPFILFFSYELLTEIAVSNVSSCVPFVRDCAPEFSHGRGRASGRALLSLIIFLQLPYEGNVNSHRGKTQRSTHVAPPIGGSFAELLKGWSRTP